MGRQKPLSNDNRRSCAIVTVGAEEQLRRN
jgi:hypothetical protein